MQAKKRMCLNRVRWAALLCAGGLGWAGSAWAQEAPPTPAITATTSTAARTSRMMEEAQRKWKEWEPWLAQMGTRLQKEAEDANKWDYMALKVAKRSSKELLAELAELGNGGWEAFEVVALSDGDHLLLRRRRGSLLSQLPMRELIQLILYQTMMNGSGN